MKNNALNRIAVITETGETEYIYTPYYEGDTPVSLAESLSKELMAIGERFALFGSIDIQCDLASEDISFDRFGSLINTPGKLTVIIPLECKITVKYFLPRIKSSAHSTTSQKNIETKFDNLKAQEPCLGLMRSSSTKEEHLNPILRKS
ncbi:MAG: hypothetical protein NUV82_02770 [Candidatus Komeilibacteria bacterium]|nr:hypothetical protein [Candidatus Komeilibacteria bacterium]